MSSSQFQTWDDMASVTCKSCGRQIELRREDEDVLRAGISLQLSCSNPECPSWKAAELAERAGLYFKQTYNPGDLR